MNELDGVGASYTTCHTLGEAAKFGGGIEKHLRILGGIVRLAGLHINNRLGIVMVASKEARNNAVVGGPEWGLSSLGDTCGNVVIGCRRVCVAGAGVTCNCLVITLG